MIKVNNYSSFLPEKWGKSKLMVLIALFLACSGNIKFFEHVMEIYPWSGNAVFLISMFLFFCAFLVLLISMFNLILPFRVVGGVLLIFASITGYFSNQFGVVIDRDMIHNLLETNASEALDLINFGIVFHVGLMGVLPAVLVWYAPIKREKWLHDKRFVLQTALISLLFMVLCFGSNSAQYTSAVREHKNLRYEINPVYPIYSIGRYVHKAIKGDQPKFKMIAGDVTRQEDDVAHELVIVVVGEAVRADHFSLNGYSRETNPRLSKIKQVLNYSQVSSCGTATAISVPCMFSFSGRKDFDRSSAKYTENVLDILKKSGVTVLWRDNNSSSKGVANRIEYVDYKSPDVNPVCDVECRDIGMLSGLQEFIDAHQEDILIVLHQMGNHGPAYYKRYPKAFEQFKPACQTNELSECSKSEIVNAYDNAILYTDYFLSEVIGLLKANEKNFETSMFYIGDHGESLGENGLYLHGMPYMFAPEAQTHVPIIVWAGDSSDIDYQRSLSLTHAPNSHDTVVHTLLETFELEIEYHEKLSFHPPLFYRKSGDEPI
ncbi:MAG: phosphoethanolamine--lipid A transferase [Magnetococcales bacterium]|nr:phosphoethanolamine--lipid A transferase [Magnetococcales bacterium]